MSEIELVVSTYLSGVAVAFIGYISLIALPRVHEGYATTGREVLLGVLFAVLSWVGVLALIIAGVLGFFQEIRQIWVERRRRK